MTAKNNDLLELHIVRHGKSSWDYAQTIDLDRPLTEKGIGNAILMAQRFFAANNLPDLIISSPANRALHTAVIFTRQLHLPFTLLKISEKLYASDIEGVVDIIRETEPGIKRLMLVGHNPTFTDLANRFLREKIDNLPTSGIVSLFFQAPDWMDITQGKLSSGIFDYPKKPHD